MQVINDTFIQSMLCGLLMATPTSHSPQQRLGKFWDSARPPSRLQSSSGTAVQRLSMLSTCGSQIWIGSLPVLDLRLGECSSLQCAVSALLSRKQGTTWCSLVLLLRPYGLNLVVDSETRFLSSQTGMSSCCGYLLPRLRLRHASAWSWLRLSFTTSGSRETTCCTTKP